ncbi:hypothetical protein NPS58_04080 [Pseudomonas putida]|uniref:hypothetical protein n=1 Tax=Pseudomonas putida TaxID=303 RepID=UPI0023636CEB|nr:hypothetical protein [Pseudomonas putida]MDD2056625.1 hypothetical protein [Pseudomonas putida]
MANDFLPFAGDAGANVLTQSAYAALGARTTGFLAGVAKSPELNKVWRQSSIMAASLAQAVADITGSDMIDNGTTAAIVAAIKNMMKLQANSTTIGPSGEKMSTLAASASATFTADEVIVKTSLGGVAYVIPNVNKTINLATVGLGGMDVGAAPVNGFVSIYLVYNPTTGVHGLLACAGTTSDGPVYTGANMPAGFTASALVSSWGTNASRLLVIAHQSNRLVSLMQNEAINTTVQQPLLQPITLTTVPPNAKSVLGWTGVTSSGTGLNKMMVASRADGLGWSQCTISGATNTDNAFRELSLITPRTIYYSVTVSTGSLVSATVSVTGYRF